jgi:maltokinase
MADPRRNVTSVSTTGRPVAGRPLPDDDVVGALRAWIPQQRWYPAKGVEARLERIAVIDLRDPAGEAAVQLHLFRLPSGGRLQVPTTLRGPDFRGPGVIGRVSAGTLVDGPQDPAFTRAWLAAAERTGAAPVADLAGLRTLDGEQSNTSLVLPSSRPPTILKIFRGLTPGPNPDVDVPLALARSGWTGVPRPIAWLAGRWPGDTGDEVGHLGVLSELISGARDGFELACEYAAAGRDFGDLATGLGRALAQMHRALRVSLPISPGRAGQASVARDVGHLLRERALAAADEVPELAARLPGIERVLAGIAELDDVPPLQRVHGDFHLGQVLRSADGSWYVLDFEGEPQASAAEKARPDLALRDVAGMLRSIDYAAAVGGSDPGWASAARRGLVAGYRSEPEGDPASDHPAVDRLLQVLELDKAVYEVVYESRNRPDWVAIPLGGVDRLVGGGG